MDVIDVCEGIREICNEKYPDFLKASNAFLLNNAFFVYLNSNNDTGSKGNELRKSALEVIRKYRGRVFLDPKATLKTKLACLISAISVRLLSYIYSKL